MDDQDHSSLEAQMEQVSINQPIDSHQDSQNETSYLDELRLEKAFALTRVGVDMPPHNHRSDRDLVKTPKLLKLEASEGREKELWPPQLAVAGRTKWILSKFGSALLALESGLGRTLTMIAVLVEMGLIDIPLKQEHRGPVLIVISSALLAADWKANFELRVAATLRVCVYQDGILDRSTTKIDPTVAELKGFDVVITTYDIIENEHRAMNSISKEQNQRPEANIANDVSKHGKCSLFAVDWWFVILDEAHNISDPNTYISQAVCDLEGKFRVLISGTPIHDEYTEFPFIPTTQCLGQGQ